MTGSEKGHSARSEAGFTLIEIMISMILLAIGMMALGLAQVQSLRIGSESKYLAQAMYLAEGST